MSGEVAVPEWLLYTCLVVGCVALWGLVLSVCELSRCLRHEQHERARAELDRDAYRSSWTSIWTGQVPDAAAGGEHHEHGGRR